MNAGSTVIERLAAFIADAEMSKLFPDGRARLVAVSPHDYSAVMVCTKDGSFQCNGKWYEPTCDIAVPAGEFQAR